MNKLVSDTRNLTRCVDHVPNYGMHKKIEEWDRKNKAFAKYITDVKR
jgi:hypothetical protein